MMKRILTPFAAFVLGLLLATGCATPVEKMQAICEEFEEVAQQTDNCDKMANNLARAQKRFERALVDAKANPPTDAENDAMIDAISGCSRAILEITSGPCADNPKVREHARPNV